MEAIGQLTGGIAHDFNNLLTTILGSLELLELRPGLDDRGRHLAQNAAAGARRAARLTSQLLSFSRRQLLRPETLMAQDIVRGIEELLAGSLREGITFSVLPPGPELWPLLADSNQTESALLNLVINARDAIEGEGRITIAFDNVTVQGRDAPTPDGLAPGDYVAIQVTDTGSGMTEETRARALEPFFTTKPAGSGTGLGLSQTYGFVRQSQGGLSIRSSEGAGTTVSILLPRAIPATAAKQEDADPATHFLASRVSGIHQARRAATAPKAARAQNASGAL
jgi:signal transduction histidine kinase